MPWEIVKNHPKCDEPFAVVKKDNHDDVSGCHPTREAAKKQLAALYANENRSVPLEGVELRSSTITDVNVRQRLIDVVAVPWNEEAEVVWHGDIWREMFIRGAFDGIEEHAGRVRVNREHVIGNTVGKVVQFTNADLGLLARNKIAKTPLGDETLELAEEDAISASVGYRIHKPSDVQIHRRNRMRRVVRAFIDHLAMVEAPAFAGAQVLAVRAEPQGLQVVEQTPRRPTPALDEVMDDAVFAWVRDRIGH